MVVTNIGQALNQGGREGVETEGGSRKGGREKEGNGMHFKVNLTTIMTKPPRVKESGHPGNYTSWSQSQP